MVPQHLCEVARFSILRQLERRLTVHFGIDLGSAIKEQSYESRISDHDGMVQGGAPTAAPGIGVCSTVQQELGNVSVPDCCHERCEPPGFPGVNVCASFEEELDHLGVSSFGRFVEGRSAFAVSGVEHRALV